MLKEFIELIQATAVKAAGPQIVKCDPYSPSAFIDNEGDISINAGLPIPRNHKALDLGAIAEFAKRFKSAVVWYNRSAVTAIIDDADRRDKVTLTMTYSDELLKLMELQKSRPWLDQRSVLTLLRTVFTPAALPMHTNLIGDLRVVKFEANQAANTDIGRGKSSVGKSAMASVEGWDKLPEVVMLTVPVFSNAFIRQRTSVNCALEVNEQEQRFQLFPLPGEVEKAIATIEDDLGDTIREMSPESTPVYYGEP